MSNYCFILSTCKNTKEAEKIISYLLKNKWIACATFFKVKSMFYWEEKLQKQAEVQIIFKTKKGSFEKIKKCILELGSYEVPEIVQIDIDQGHLPYLCWIHDTVK